MHDALISLGEFCRKTVRHWYALGIGVIGGFLGLASTLYAEVKPKAHPLVPLWVWLPLLAGGFLVAIIWAFHDVRMEREAAMNEIKRRFSVLRYALQREAIDYRLNLCPDATWSVEVGLRLKNNSDEHLRYEIERMNVVIEGRSVENPQFYNRGVIIAPKGADVFRYPFICSVPNGWQQGSIEFTMLYGHPSVALQYRKSQTLKLTTSRLFGAAPPHDIHIQADLVRESEVEDVLATGPVACPIERSLAREPDIQFFRQSGTWHRPEGAVRVEVMIKGGDGGGSVGEDGSIIPGEQGQVVIQEMSAEEVGATAQIVIGEAGRGDSRGGLKAPDGNPGFAVVRTYFE